MLLTSVNLSLTKLRSMEMSSTNKNEFSDTSLGVSEIGIVEGVLLSKGKPN